MIPPVRSIEWVHKVLNRMFARDVPEYGQRLDSEGQLMTTV
jgi:hypothetical protein